MKKTTICLSGPVNLGPIGRHLLSFLTTLSANPSLKILIDAEAMGRLIPEDAVTINPIIERSRATVGVPNGPYDFLIFTGILSQKFGDDRVQRNINIPADIKICYPVFDGTVAPIEWSTIINQHFDFALSPSHEIAHQLRRSGVTKPCFGLHCAIFNDELLEHSPQVVTPFRFGFIGAGEQRKNVVKVIEAFDRVFAGKKDVELYLHCSYSYEPSYREAIKQSVQNVGERSCIFLKDFTRVSHKDITELYASMHAYVYPSKATGYFTTPAEALSLGIPVAISDIPVHLEMCETLGEEDGIFLIRTDQAEPLAHQSLHGRFLGVQYDCRVEDIAEQMRRLYESRHELFEPKKIERRKAIGRQYNAVSLASMYTTLVQPSSLARSEGLSGIVDGQLYLHDDVVLEKYRRLYPACAITTANMPPTVIYKARDPDKTNLIEFFSRLTQKDYWRMHELEAELAATKTRPSV